MIERLTSVKVQLFTWQGLVATIVAAGVGLVSAGLIFRALGGPGAH